MIRNCLSTLILVVLLQACAYPANAQNTTLTFKKGRAIDFLFLTTKPDTEAKLKDYFATVFPIVKDAGYQPMPSFQVSENTQGNHHPTTLVIASWRDAESRAEAMQAIHEQVPDFHQRRRDIWSVFDMTVYEMEEDTSLVVDPNKVYVLTAYWHESAAGFEAFKKEWLAKTRRAGGSVQLELKDGTSPFGYRYDPDYLVITEWKDRKSFDRFYAKNLAMSHEAVGHVNQFILSPPPPKKK